MLERWKRSVRWRCALAVALLSPVCIPASAGAYNEDGHFYTAIAVEHARTPPYPSQDATSRKAALIGFCAQLPDLSYDYDATSLRVNLLLSPRSYLWGAFSV